ncbi:hypothetical protein F3Y22_tig00111377pilonHSYRG00029 [Hibiscus syriacus]|uniref:BED-type domain-containing protein n=1 Tax=Hibiscus syriacus TaxID=106335 RepID=A0A6A2YMM5_HIBSY|nr:hypothetical protein F3Y22_tig00111377pilonHSYRG00029 [Hibiscus syriacus]
MPPRIEKFPTEGLEGAPSIDIGRYFGDPVPNTKGNIVCKLCGKVVKGGITRFKEHIAHKTGEVAPCPNVTDDVSAMRQATQESIQSQYEWHRREEFRRSTGGWDNIYEEGRSSSLGSHGRYREERVDFSLRGTIPELVKSKRSRQPKVSESILKILRKKMGETVSKFIIYDRLPFRLASSPWLYNLIQVSMEVGKGVKLPTPYEISYVYLTSEYEQVREWVNELKTHWKQLDATLMCDGWTNSLNQMHIINFLVYCSKETIFWKSVDVSSVRSRDIEFYYNLLDKVVEEIGEEYIIQIVTDNEAAMKTAGKRLMLKRNHLYRTSCAAHCLDLCLEDIGKKSSIAKVLEEAKKVTCFIYNHIWTVDLVKKYTHEWLQEKENPLLDGENAGVLPVDTSYDEMNVDDQSQQQNLSHSSSSATLSSGHFCASSSRERNEPRARSKGKGKDTRKHTSEGSSSGKRSTSSNPGYSNSSTSTHGFYPQGQSSYFQPPHGFYPPYPNYGVPYQPQMYPPPPMYHPPPLHMYPPPQVYPPSQLFENQCENVTFFGYIFGQRPQRSSGDHSQSEGKGSDLSRYSTNW